MQNPDADRSLLYGVLALQMDFITRDALVLAMNTWVLDKGRPLGLILVDHGELTAEEHALLDAMVSKHIEKHGGDARQSLMSLSPVPRLHETLVVIEDTDLISSLASYPGRHEEDPYITRISNADMFHDNRTHSPGSSSACRFKVLRPHAKGGLGIVSVAEDMELRREVALKEIQERHADDPFSQARFLLEAKVTGSLEHPGIIPVYGLGHYDDGRPFYAMRFIRGNTLEDEIRRFHDEEKDQTAADRELSFRKLLGRFIDVCEAIDYAHSRGILHRDIKPANVMIGDYGETLVVDWGLAKILDRPDHEVSSFSKPFVPSAASGSAMTMQGSIVGTPQFMSPEQAAGHLELLNCRSDVYSLGATLYVLLTNQLPFGRIRIEDLFSRIRDGQINPPRRVVPTVPRALESVCMKAMAKAPEDRYRSARDLSQDIENWLADERVTAHCESIFAERLRRIRKRPARLAWLFFLALFNFIAVPIWFATWIFGSKLRSINKDFGVDFSDYLALPALLPDIVQLGIMNAFVGTIMPIFLAIGLSLVLAEFGALFGYLLDSGLQVVQRRDKPSRAFTVLGLISGLIYGVASSYETYRNFQAFLQIWTKLSG